MKKIYRVLLVIAGLLCIGFIMSGYFYLTDDYDELINLDSDDAVLMKEDMTPYTGRLLPYFSGYSGKFVDGKKVGEHKKYVFGGFIPKLKSVAQYDQEGLRNGDWKEWEDGRLLSWERYATGKLDGPQEFWNHEGEIIHLNYNDNEIVHWVNDYLDNSEKLLPIEGIYIVDKEEPFDFAIIKYRSQVIAINIDEREGSEWIFGDVYWVLNKKGTEHYEGTYFAKPRSEREIDGKNYNVSILSINDEFIEVKSSSANKITKIYRKRHRT